jgi:hypothetical protein
MPRCYFDLTDEKVRATLLEQGFTVGQLGHLVFSGLAKLRGTSRTK